MLGKVNVQERRDASLLCAAVIHPMFRSLVLKRSASSAFPQESGQVSISRRPARKIRLGKARPPIYHQFEVLVELSDGSVVKRKSQFPKNEIRLIQDQRNNPLWNPTRTDLIVVDANASGKVDKFKQKYGSIFFSEDKPKFHSNESELKAKDRAAAESKTQAEAEDDDEFGMDDYLSLLNEGSKQIKTGHSEYFRNEVELAITTTEKFIIYKMGSVFLPHLRTGWHVDQAIVRETERLVVIRFGRDWDRQCMIMDEMLYSIAEKVKNFAAIYLCDIEEVPDFNDMYELQDPMTVMFFYQNKHMMCDFGTGDNNKMNFLVDDKQELIDVIECIFRGARKNKGLVISPYDYNHKRVSEGSKATG